MQIFSLTKQVKRRLSPQAWRENLQGYFFIAPWLVGLFVFVLFPIVASLYLSFTDYQIVQPPVFTGLTNYRFLVQDPPFWQALKVTTVYALVSVPLGLVLSFAVALLMNQPLRLRGFWRTIYCLPNLVPVIASSVLWVWIFNPQFGLLNLLLHKIGIEGPILCNSTRWALPSLIMMSLWGAGADADLPGRSPGDPHRPVRGGGH